jgi:hypothetical protein
LVFFLSYIQSCVLGPPKYSGTRCGNYSLIPRRLTALIKRKILDSAVDEVSEALSMHVAPPAIQKVVLPARVIVLLWLYNPLCSWTNMVGPSLPGFTIAPCVDSLICYRLIRRLSLPFKTVPKSEVRVCIYIIAFELSDSSLC